MSFGKNSLYWTVIYFLLLIACSTNLLLITSLYIYDGRIGSDYAYFLPNLLAGMYWSVNNFPSLPRYLPTFCGGMPYFYNPQNSYFSLQQILLAFFDPVASALLVAIVFNILGGFGMYVLARRRFACSVPAALVATVIFMLNGCFVARVAIGHMTFYWIMIIPWLALFATGASLGKTFRANLCAIIASATLLAFGVSLAFYAGAVIPLLPLALAVLILVTLCHTIVGISWQWVATAGLSLVIVLGLCAMKLVPGLIFAGHFPRDYDFFLIGDLSLLLQRLVFVLFLPQATPLVVAKSELIHEYQYAVGIVPLVVLLALAAGLVLPGRNGKRLRASLRATVGKTPAGVVALLLLLAFPALAVYDSAFATGLLHKVPVVQNMYRLDRFWLAYVPFLAIVAALGLDRLVRAERQRLIGGSFAILVTTVQLVALDAPITPVPVYDPSHVIEAWLAVRATKSPPPIARIAAAEALPVHQPPINDFVARNDGLTRGFTTTMCDEALFGYDLENFPKADNLRFGPTLAANGGVLNIRNPACYVFGRLNGCEPGDNFRADQRAEAEAFIAYEPVPFREPWWQRALEWLALATLATTLAGLIFCWLFGLKQRQREAGPAGTGP